MNDDIQNLIDQDIADYKNDAYLMWRFQEKPPSSLYDKTLMQIRNIDINWQDAKSNMIFIDREFFILQRKDSVALPFDLERAKAGDDVEYQSHYGINGWVDCKLTFFDNGMIGVSFYCGDGSASPSFLRMKYPPKVQP